jgi:hypothetical protein
VLADPRRHHRADPVDPALGVGERPVLLEERRPRQQHVSELGRLVLEQVLYDEQVERRQSRVHVLGVRVGLRDVLALDEQRAERAVERGVEHVRDPQPGLLEDRRPPEVVVDLAHRGVRHVPVAGQLVRERAHVAGALHVVLSTQRVDADALAADVAGGHREVGHAHHHRGALAVLGDAEAVVNRRVRPGGIHPRGGTQVLCGYAAHRLECLG